jgi:hypothetical protein
MGRAEEKLYAQACRMIHGRYEEAYDRLVDKGLEPDHARDLLVRAAADVVRRGLRNAYLQMIGGLLITVGAVLLAVVATTSQRVVRDWRLKITFIVLGLAVLVIGFQSRAKWLARRRWAEELAAAGP